jgi:thiamine-phosphate pyrophosphorylase
VHCDVPETPIGAATRGLLLERRHDLVLYAESAHSVATTVRGYYAIVDATPASIQMGGDGAALEARVARLLAAGPCCLQLRAKAATARALEAAGRRLLPQCRAAGVPFCVNDRLDVALAVGADVVHLGQDDLPLADAQRVRAAAGRPDLRIGFSTHNLEQARAAATAGADYIGFGPVFGTRSKANPDPIVGLERLAEVCRAVSVPVVAIGGITLDAVPAVARAGAAAAAIIAAIDAASDPTAAGRAVAAAFAPRG